MVSVTVTSGPIVIVGAGGFGREVLDVIEAVNAAGGDLEFRGFVDDGPVDEELVARRGARLLGTSEALPGMDVSFVVAIGSGAVRARVVERLPSGLSAPALLVHPASTVGGDNRISPGCILTAGCRVTTNITLGSHVQLHVNSTVGHDSKLGDFVSVYPGATVSGNVTIGAGASIGTGANVLPGVTIGDGAFVGAGAVVTGDVEPGETVVGSPARSLRPKAHDKAGSREA